jgi:hypothetical protein
MKCSAYQLGVYPWTAARVSLMNSLSYYQGGSHIVSTSAHIVFGRIHRPTPPGVDLQYEIKVCLVSPGHYCSEN